MKKYIAGTTKDGHKIFYRKNKYKQVPDEMKTLIKEALPWLTYNKFPQVYTFNFDRVIGSTRLVELYEDQKEKTFWVYRKNNLAWRAPVLIGGHSRFTTKLTVVFDKTDDAIYIADCYFGQRVLPLPGCSAIRKRNVGFKKRCHHFWLNHALAIPPEEIDIPKTLEKLNNEDADRFLHYINEM